MDLEIPGLENYSKELKEKLSSLQIENVFTGRTFFLLLYYWITDKKSDNFKICKENIMLAKKETTEHLDSLSSQVFVKMIKNIFLKPHEFVESLNTSYKYLDANLFAYSTFPAIYGFFTTSYLTDNASSFVFELICSRLPDKFVSPIFTAFLFSAYSFSNQFWRYFSDFLFDNEVITESDILNLICVTMAITCSCIPPPLYLLLRGTKTFRPELIESSFAFFLKTTLNLWINFSMDVTGFNNSDTIEEMVSNVLSKQENVALILSSFLNEKQRIDQLPSFIGNCKFKAEWLSLSHIDLVNLSIAYKPISSHIDMFKSFEKTIQAKKTIDPFTPYAFNLFLKTKIYLPKEPVLFQGEYTNAKLDFMITLGFNLKKAESFQLNINDLRNVLISSYITKDLQSITRAIPPSSLHPAVLRYVERGDPNFFIRCVFITLFDIISPIRVSQSISNMFRQVMNETKSNVWKRNGFISNKIIQKYLLKYFKKHGKRTYGTMFKHITGFLKTFMIINDSKKITHENDIFKIFLTSLNYDEILETFIFLERIAFREPLFLKNMPPSLSTEWSNLFQILWEICSQNPKLLDQLLEFDPLRY